MTMNSTSKNTRPLFRRIFAFIIDLIILGTTCTVLGKYLITYFSGTPFIFHLIGTFICLFYFSIFNSNILDGKTIGKMICSLQVTNLSNQPITFLRAFSRSCIFAIPLCFTGYLQSLSQQSLGLSILKALLISILIINFYLIIFNRKTSQSLHDILSNTQVQNPKNYFVAKPPIWKTHYIVSIVLLVIIFINSIWLHSKTDSVDIEKLGLSRSIQSLSIENRYLSLGETISQNNILIFNVDTHQELNDRDFISQQIMALKSAHPKLFKENKINQIQLNSSYQFGLAKISKSIIYDLNFNQGKVFISFNSEKSSTKFGF